MNATFDTVVIGAGLSGLTTAYHLTKQGYRVLVLEKNDRPGGAVLSHSLGGFLCEGGPNSLQEIPAFISLVKELGLEERLVFADPKSPRYVYWKNKLRAVPLNPPAFVTSPLISPFGKLRAALELFIPRGAKEDESIAEFVERRLGQEILVKLVGPFVSGVFAGDPHKLSVADALPRLKALENEHGSLIRSLLKKSQKQQGPSPIKRLCSFKNGLAELPYALANTLGEAVQYQSNIQRLEKVRDTSGYRLYLEDGRSCDATTVICTSPAYITATLLADFSPKAAQELNQIVYPAATTVCLAYPDTAFSPSRPSPCGTGGFGHLIPREQGVRSLGGIWNSSLFSGRGRAPKGWQLITCFIGGTTDPEAQTLSEEDLFQTAHKDLQTVLGVTGEAKNVSLTRWKKAIPQYGIGHRERITKILEETEKLPGFYLAANYIDGVALGDCFTRANRQADTIVEFLKTLKTRPAFTDRGA